MAAAFSAAALPIDVALRHASEFQRFLTAFSERLGRSFAMCLHALPQRACASTRIASSSSVQSSSRGFLSFFFVGWEAFARPAAEFGALSLASEDASSRPSRRRAGLWRRGGARAAAALAAQNLAEALAVRHPRQRWRRRDVHRCELADRWRWRTAAGCHESELSVCACATAAAAVRRGERSARAPSRGADRPPAAGPSRRRTAPALHGGRRALLPPRPRSGHRPAAARGTAPGDSRRDEASTLHTA